MRFRIAVLLLFAVLPALQVIAAPAPPISAILDIGPPPKGMTAEEYCKDEIGHLTHPYAMLFDVWRDPKVSKFALIARLKDARPWLSENLEVRLVSGSNRLLRLRFRAGSSALQVAILNSLLRVNLQLEARRLRGSEEALRLVEEAVPQLEKLVATETEPRLLERYRQDLKNAPSHIAEIRVRIAQRKQIAVIRWAK